ncbi:MAG TPA: hypothetical protein VFK43_23510, partial [Acidimicrobiales bacterium]|nr:hypothetical protein [Acidimicrobiales bacterium]
MIARFLEEWLGRWPPASARDIVVHALRDEPEWDGVVRTVKGVADGDGRWVVSVAPSAAGPDDPTAGTAMFEGVFRY